MIPESRIPIKFDLDRSPCDNDFSSLIVFIKYIRATE